MRVAVVQLTSGDGVEDNLARASHWIGEAAEAGAELVALPESFAYLAGESAGPNPSAQPLEGPVVGFLRDHAKRHGVVLAGGSFAEAIPGEERVYNTSVVVDSEGRLLAVYRKLHLFDVDLPGVTLCESTHVAPGREVLTAQVGDWVLGLSICYDLRFPELYRELVAQGATLLLVPSAFTIPTGRDHWEVLLRARAIESQCYVLAAAQVGEHAPGRASYGHSLIVDPWGEVLASLARDEGIAVAELDRDRLWEIRRNLPALDHRRLGRSGPR
ncbi:MAG: carbon-nitrogen hydrolase family protein [Myxococcota bacterium]